VRIFNTYGPRMRVDDGRIVPNFIQQSLLGQPLTVYGDGSQSRSVQYIDDLIEGVLRLMRRTENRPVNIGNPHEMSVREVAEMILEISGSRSGMVHEPLPEDDPKRRYPDITRARACYELGRKLHRNVDSTVGLVPSRSLFSAFPKLFQIEFITTSRNVLNWEPRVPAE